MTEFQPQVVRIKEVSKHPNADALEITHVLGDYPVVIRSGEFKSGDLAAYLPVDTIPSLMEPLLFLQGKRIKAKKLRGFYSQGVLVRPPLNASEGDSILESYKLTKHVYPEEMDDLPPDNISSSVKTGNREHCPIQIPYYDLEGLRKYSNIFSPEEEIVLSEKIEGCNAAYFHDGTRLWAKSRNHFYKKDSENLWWDPAIRHDLETKLSLHPMKVFYAELYGQVKHFRYDVEIKNNKPITKLRFFDIYDLNSKLFLSYDEMKDTISSINLEVAPEIYRGPWTSKEFIYPYANGNSLMASHIKEGFVIRPIKEAIDPHLGRVILKLKGEEYMLMK